MFQSTPGHRRCAHGLHWLAVAAVLGVGCGYRFLAPNSTLPGGVSRVSIPLFANATAEPGAEALFTAALRERFLRAGRLGGTEEEAVVVGQVVQLSSAPLVVSPAGGLTYRLSAAVSLTLRRGNEVLASVTVTGQEDYPAGADVLWSETNRGAALRRLADSTMQDGAAQLATGW